MKEIIVLENNNEETISFTHNSEGKALITLNYGDEFKIDSVDELNQIIEQLETLKIKIANVK